MSGSLDTLKSYVNGLVSEVTVDKVLLDVAKMLNGEPIASVVTPEPIAAEATKAKRAARGSRREYLPVVPWAKKYGLENFSTKQCVDDMRAKGVNGIPRDDATAMKVVANALSKSAGSIWNLGNGMWRYKSGPRQPSF